jgi:hypothetical protein
MSPGSRVDTEIYRCERDITLVKDGTLVIRDADGNDIGREFVRRLSARIRGLENGTVKLGMGHGKPSLNGQPTTKPRKRKPTAPKPPKRSPQYEETARVLVEVADWFPTSEIAARVGVSGLQLTAVLRSLHENGRVESKDVHGPMGGSPKKWWRAVQS